MGLPQIAYVQNPATNEIVLVKRYMFGYYPCPGMTAEAADIKNKHLGVTPEMAEAMLIGSMFGWDCPAAQVKGENK